VLTTNIAPEAALEKIAIERIGLEVTPPIECAYRIGKQKGKWPILVKFCNRHQDKHAIVSNVRKLKGEKSHHRRFDTGGAGHAAHHPERSKGCLRQWHRLQSAPHRFARQRELHSCGRAEQWMKSAARPPTARSQTSARLQSS
jgi:hypothetical protein